MSVETKIVEKRKQRLLKREKDHLVISHTKLQSYCRFQIDVNWSYYNHSVLHDRGELELLQPLSSSRSHANTPVAATKPVSAKPDLQQSFHFPNTFLQLPPSQNPVIDFSTPARDLKDSFQGVTVPQPVPKIVVQTSQQRYLPNQNLTSYPTFPNPLPNSCAIAIRKYCHKNVSICYGCS